MNVLLINPYISDFTAYDLWLRPLGLYSIAAVIRRYSQVNLHWIDVLDRFQPGTGINFRGDGRGKFHRSILSKPYIYQTIPRNYSLYGIPWELFLKKLDALPSPDLVFITTLMSYWLDGIGVVLKELKKRFPRAKHVIGGVIPTLLGNDAEKHLKAEIYISGPGEKRVLEIIAENGGRISDEAKKLDEFKFPNPAWDLASDLTSAPLLTSRGCPYHCLYCASSQLHPFFFERNAEDVISEIQGMQKSGVKHIILFDDALLLNRQERFLKIFHKFQKLGLNFHTPNGLHTSEIDQEVARVMFQSGFQTLRLSFESLSENILRDSREKVNIQQMSRSISFLEQAGYSRSDIEVYILFGYPKQTMKDLETMLDFIEEEGVFPRLSVFSPVPATPIFRELQQEGILSDPINLYETNKIYYLFEKSGFSEEMIRSIKNRISQMKLKPRKSSR